MSDEPYISDEIGTVTAEQSAELLRSEAEKPLTPKPLVEFNPPELKPGQRFWGTAYSGTPENRTVWLGFYDYGAEPKIVDLPLPAARSLHKELGKMLDKLEPVERGRQGYL